MTPAAQRVVFRFLIRVAQQLPGQRSHASKLTRPINRPRGISPQILEDEAVSKSEGEGIVVPDTRDIRPKDVFSPPQPRNVAVRNLVETGEGLSPSVKERVRGDRGYPTVKSLSQYLLQTGGGGEGGSEGV